MGMFDTVLYNGVDWQTKDLRCNLDTYTIDEDGVLWGEEYDIVDRSDPNAKGLARFAGMCTRENVKPRREFFTGRMYLIGGDDPPFEEIVLVFVNGVLQANENGLKIETENRYNASRVQNCARCGDDHTDVVFLRFKRAVGDYTHWTTCPKTGEPIVMRVIDD